MRKLSYFLVIIAASVILQSFLVKKQKTEPEKIKWYTFQEAVELNKKNPKKIFIDVYTSWCGWCKRMDATTFTNPVVIKEMNKYFYAVKMDAEMSDTIIFSGNTFVNTNPSAPRSPHQLASALLDNQMSYPTTVYLDENFSIMNRSAGYLGPENLEPILIFLGENKYKTIKWEEFMKTFKGEVR